MTVQVVRSFGSDGARLYVCSTPIGNLQDTSFRLVETLKSVDVVAAEDTRQTRKLLTHFDIHPPLLVSYHQHNQSAREDDLRRWWSEGKSVAIVSDAGTPIVSDPGEGAVRCALEAGVPVVPIPGPSAVLGALVSCGFPVQPFTFIGFLPRGKKSIREALQSYTQLPGAIVFYEAPHRLLQTLRSLADVFANRPAVVAKELTKKFETFLYGDSVDELVTYFEENDAKGEFVIIIGPPPLGTEAGVAQSAAQDGDVAETPEETERRAIQLVLERVRQGTPHATAVREVAEELGIRRKTLYQLTLGGDANTP